MKKKEYEPQVIEHEANGSFISKGVAEFVKAKILEENFKIDHLKMAKSQWKKIVKLYEEVDGMKESNAEFVTIPVILDRVVPESEIWYCAKDDSVVGKILGLER